jgi:hypothetical protein
MDYACTGLQDSMSVLGLLMRVLYVNQSGIIGVLDPYMRVLGLHYVCT